MSNESYNVANESSFTSGLPLKQLAELQRNLDELIGVVESQRQQIKRLEDHFLSESQESRKTVSNEIHALKVQVSALDRRWILSQTATNEHSTALKALNTKLSQLQQQQQVSDSPLLSELLKIKADVNQLNYDWHKANSDSRNGMPQIFRDDNGTEYLNPLYESNGTYCLSWNVDSDEWWTHHVDWEVTNETDEGYCFSPMDGENKRSLLRRLYHIQFRSDCAQARTKRMWNSGWGADFANIVDGLNKALESNQPTTLKNPFWWKYAVKKDGSDPVCPKQDMSCYFLPLSRCTPDPDKAWPGIFYNYWQPSFLSEQNRLLTWYATRPQTWLRREVYEFSKKIPLITPCTVFHVRRSDVILDPSVRRYFGIEEYMNATESITKTIFLLTDDDNAIREAKSKYPAHDWVIIDRPRYKGSEGGWGAHIPSGNPKLEVIVLLSIFRTVQKCGVFVHAFSNLSEYIAGIMMTARGDDLIRVDLNEKGNLEVYNPHYANTANLSRSDWQ